MTDRRRGRLRWGLVVALIIAVSVLAWALTESVVWLGVGVAFAVMFAVAATASRDDR